jgi:hypothetical protein
MIPASYVVIRYIADPARNEPLNVGVLAWSANRHELAISEEAIARVVRENPRLHPDALRSLKHVIAERLSLDPHLPGGEIRERLDEHANYPVTFSEPRQTTVSSGEAEDLSVTVGRLVERIVKPGRRYGGGGADLHRMLSARLQPLIRQGSVRADHLFASTTTGVARRVDFFANSRANVAIDTLRLDVKKATDIRTRADAEAFKVTDIMTKNDVHVLVVASLPQSEDLAEARAEAQLILTSTRAEVIEDIDAAADRVETAAHAAGGQSV